MTRLYHYSYGEQKTVMLLKIFLVSYYDDGSGVKSGVVNFCSDAFYDLQSTFGKAMIEKYYSRKGSWRSLFNPSNSKPMGRRQFWFGLQLHAMTTYTFTDMLGNRVQNYSKEDLKEVQSALNFFGFKAGNADGVLGRKTKRAIAQYNVCLDIGEYVDLTEKARNLLVKTYQKYKTVSSLGEVAGIC